VKPIADAVAGPGIQIGWGQADLTPTQAVLVAGQFHARVSEGVADPITATALALDTDADHVVFVSCDLVAVWDGLRDAVRGRLAGIPGGPDPLKVVLHATHTHTGPEIRPPEAGAGHTAKGEGIDLPVMPVGDYVAFAAERIAHAVQQAWRTRAPGAIAFGQGCAVVGRNRRWVDTGGRATMYGNTDTPGFSHIEGCEDHSVNVLATLDARGALTGLVVNVPCSSQASEHEFTLSADYWCESRRELRRRLGDGLFVLPQCSAAGDQSPHLLFDKCAAARMLELKGRTARQEIACRIADAVEDTLRAAGRASDSAPLLTHHIERVELPLAELAEADVRTALQEAEALRGRYAEELKKLEEHPELRLDRRWYCPVTFAYRRMRWLEGVAERFRRQAARPCVPVELHVVRLGDVVFATNPFEYYLDFGIYIKARSKAVQTFLVQLAGEGTYVPSRRSVAGGGYGSIPASNPVGSDGGRQLAERTVAVIEALWAPGG
jgi:hypothetical protein